MTPLAAAQVSAGVVAATLAAIVAWEALRGRVAGSTATGLLLVLVGVLIGELRLVPTWVVRDAWLIGFPTVLATYPDGQFVPRWTRVVLAGAVIVALADFAGQGWLLDGWVAPFVLGPITMVFLACQVHRYRRRSTIDERTRVRWPVLFVGWTIVGYGVLSVLSDEPPGMGTGWPAAATAGLGLLPQLGLVIGLIRPRLADIDRLLRESVRWLSLATVTIGSYLGAGALATSAGWQSVADQIAAAGAVIAALVARRATALLADRFVGAAKPDPVRTLSALGERYEQSLDGDELAGSIARTIANALLLSDVAVTVIGSETEFVGPAVMSRSERFDVVYQGETVGTIRVGPRAAELELSSRDRSLLRLLAAHAGPAMHAVRVVADLRRAREHLVLAREEERRRLRRDLHDDVAPQLAGLALSGAAIRQLVTTDPAKAIDLAGRLADDLRRASQQVREITYDLRPPVLDDLGLTAAIVDRVSRDAGAPNIVVDAPEKRLELPAAVELAALRIVQEAVTNSRRHARASECRVVLQLDGHDLLVEIRDDGRGFGAGVRRGVGLRSIAERAAELGGTSDVRSSPGGTSVLVRLPLAIEGGP